MIEIQKKLEADQNRGTKVKNYCDSHPRDKVSLVEISKELKHKNLHNKKQIENSYKNRAIPYRSPNSETNSSHQNRKIRNHDDSIKGIISIAKNNEVNFTSHNDRNNGSGNCSVEDSTCSNSVYAMKEYNVGNTSVTSTDVKSSFTDDEEKDQSNEINEFAAADNSTQHKTTSTKTKIEDGNESNSNKTPIAAYSNKRKYQEIYDTESVCGTISCDAKSQSSLGSIPITPKSLQINFEARRKKTIATNCDHVGKKTTVTSCNDLKHYLMPTAQHFREMQTEHSKFAMLHQMLPLELEKFHLLNEEFNQLPNSITSQKMLIKYREMELSFIQLCRKCNVNLTKHENYSRSIYLKGKLIFGYKGISDKKGYNTRMSTPNLSKNFKQIRPNSFLETHKFNSDSETSSQSSSIFHSPASIQSESNPMIKTQIITPWKQNSIATTIGFSTPLRDNTSKAKKMKRKLYHEIDSSQDIPPAKVKNTRINLHHSLSPFLLLNPTKLSVSRISPCSFWY